MITLFPLTTPLDLVVKTWLSAVDGRDDRVALIRVLGYVFMIQVRHNVMFSHITAHISRYRYILDPNKVLVAHAINTLTTNQAIKLRWVLITRDL